MNFIAPRGPIGRSDAKCVLCASRAGKKPFEISFDSAYLTDMLRSLQPDAALTLDMLEPETPAVFRYDPQFLYVVVPLSKP